MRFFAVISSCLLLLAGVSATRPEVIHPANTAESIKGPALKQATRSQIINRATRVRSKRAANSPVPVSITPGDGKNFLITLGGSGTNYDGQYTMVDSGSGAVMVTPLISSASQFTLDVSGRLVVSAGPASGYIFGNNKGIISSSHGYYGNALPSNFYSGSNPSYTAATASFSNIGTLSFMLGSWSLLYTDGGQTSAAYANHLYVGDSQYQGVNGNKQNKVVTGTAVLI